eukprot:c26201_g1_i1 orf=520-1713(-)
MVANLHLLNHSCPLPSSAPHNGGLLPAAAHCYFGAICRLPRLEPGFLLCSSVSLKGRCWKPGRRWATVCVESGRDDSETVELRDSSSQLSASSSSPIGLASLLSSYGLITCVATSGFVETAYLAFTKLSGGAVSCPIGGSSCNYVLNSDYAMVFGIPLSMVGMVSYGAVGLLGLFGFTKTAVKIVEVDLIPWLLLVTTGSMTVASICFMYILVTKLDGASCTYCVASALLSFSLFLLTLRKFSSRDLKQVAGVQLAVTASVLVALSAAYGGLDSASAGSPKIDLAPVEPEVTTVSSTTKMSLAKHLKSLGAKMYGAFWCSHCYEQKQMFGREALGYLEYVECYPEGYRQGVKMATACYEANIQGFPTWIINGKVFSGEQKLSELARISGFDASSFPD